jgi:4-hydroxy-tetrahydrodipicolinate synthase
MFGIHTALVTPFDAAGDVDLAAFERICHAQVGGGVHGIVVGGTTGESPTLSASELEALTRTARAVAGGRIPVSVGVGTNDTRSSVARAEAAARWGASTGLLVLPYYNKPNAVGHRRHVAAVAAVGLPLVVYHVPGRTGQRLDAGFLAELAEMPGVVAVKEATGDVRYGTDLLRRTRTPVLSGDDFTFLGLLAQGAAGCVSVVSNVAPAATVAVYDAHVAGDRVAAAAALARIWPLVTWLFADTSPVPCKAAMEALGLCRRDVRLPLANWDGPVPEALLEPARA